MRFDGKIQQNGIYGKLVHNRFLELSKPLTHWWIIHFHHNTVSFEAQNENSKELIMLALTSPPNPLSPASGGIFNMKWRGGQRGEVENTRI